MAAHTERAAHVEALLSATSTGAGVVLEHAARFDAVVPTCSRAGQPCRLHQAAPLFNESAILAMEPPKLRLHTPQRERAGTIGNFLSHMGAYADFLAAGAAGAEYLLVMEDDAGLSTDFFEQLPCLLRELPARLGPFHAVRFGCWGKRFAADCIAPAAPPLTRGVFHARPHSYSAEEAAAQAGGGVAYGGAHLTLVRRATLQELFEHLAAQGVAPIDLALREPPAAKNKGGGGGAPPRIRSYVLDSPVAWIAHDDVLLPGWRHNPPE